MKPHPNPIRFGSRLSSVPPQRYPDSNTHYRIFARPADVLPYRYEQSPAPEVLALDQRSGLPNRFQMDLAFGMHLMGVYDRNEDRPGARHRHARYPAPWLRMEHHDHPLQSPSSVDPDTDPVPGPVVVRLCPQHRLPLDDLLHCCVLVLAGPDSRVLRHPCSSWMVAVGPHLLFGGHVFQDDMHWRNRDDAIVE